MRSTTKGMILGLGTVVAVAVGFGVLVALDPPLRGHAGDGEELGFGFAFYVGNGVLAHEIALLVLVVGAVPACVAGYGLGHLAGRLRVPPLARFGLLGFLSDIAVALLGMLPHEPVLVAVACVPALLAAAALERWTRQPVLGQSATSR